jgi:pyroglutamyl-peptidase
MELSPSAGTFLCNHVFYGLVDWIHGEDPSVMGGFVHVPYLWEQLPWHPGAPFLDLDELVKGVRETIMLLQA